MKTLAVKILTSLCNKYINDIEESQLNVGLLQGTVELQNLQIKSSALSIHDLPFTVASGSIRSLKLHFPWTQLYTMPCKISIEGISIVAYFTKNIEQKTESEMKDNILEELEKACQKETKSSIFYQLFGTIIDNIIVNFKDIHIQVELPNSEHSTAVYTAGIILNEIKCFTIDDSNDPGFTNSSNTHLKKRLIINDFSLYIDSSEKQTDHEYILKSFSLSSLFERTKDENHQAKTEISHNISNLTFQLNRSQLKAFGECLYQQNMYNLRKKYFKCGHPSSLPRSQRSSGKWWRFLHRCTIEKRYPNRLNIDQTIQMLKVRNQYLDLWEIKSTMDPASFVNSQYYTKIKEIQKSLDLDTILFLRSYCNYKLRMKNQNSGNEHNSDINMAEINQLLSENSELTTSLMSLAIEKAEINLYDSFADDTPELQIGAYGLNGSFSKSINRQLLLLINCNLIKIFSKDKIIFQQGKEFSSIQTIPKDSIFSLKFISSPQKLEDELAIYSFAPLINVDMKLLAPLKRKFIDYGLKSYPSAEIYNKASSLDPSLFHSQSQTHTIKQGEYAKFILQKKCDEYPYFKISMKFRNPNIKISGTNLDFAIDDIELDSFPIHERSVNKIETIYNDYKCTFKDFSISLNNKLILTPVTTTIKLASIITPVEWMDKLKIDLNMSSIAVNISKKDYIEIVSGFNSLMGLPQELSHKQETIVKVKEHQMKTDELDTLKSKISFCIQEISLSLESAGEFKIINFYSLISMNAIQSDFKFQFRNIQCISIQKKYIDFDVNTNQQNQFDFNPESNAIVGNLTSCANQPMKTEIFIKSPTIVVDFEWIEQTIDFFKCAKFNFNSKQIETSRQTQTAFSTDSSLINIKLRNPQLKFVLPTIDKESGQIEIKLGFESIDIDQHLKQYLLSNFTLMINDKILSQDSDIAFAKSRIHTDYLELNLEEPDYPLIIEFISYISNLYSYYFPKQQEEKAIEENHSLLEITISILHFTLQNHISLQLEDALLRCSDIFRIELNQIFIFELPTSKLFATSPKLIVEMNNRNFSLKFDQSTSLLIDDNPTTANFLINYFTKEQPKIIKSELNSENQDKTPHNSPFSIDIKFDNLNLTLMQTIFNFRSLDILMKVESQSKLYQISSQNLRNQGQKFLDFDSLAITFDNNLIDLTMSNFDLIYDISRIMKYYSLISQIISDDYASEKSNNDSISILDFAYNVCLNNSFIHLPTVSIALGKVAFMNSTDKKQDYTLNIDNIAFTSTKRQQLFMSISNSNILCALDVQHTKPPLLGDKSNMTQNENANLQKNYLHGFDIKAEIESFKLIHDYDVINEFCISLNSIFNKKSRNEGKEKVKFELYSTISLNLKTFALTIPQFQRILEFQSLSFHSFNEDKNIQIGSFQLNSQSLQLSSKQQTLLSINIDETAMEITVADAQLKIDIKSKIIVQIYKALINSPFLTKLTVFNSQNKDNSSKSKFLKFSMQNSKIILANDDLLLSLFLSIKYISNNSNLNITVSNLTTSFIENQREYPPLFNNLGINFQMNNNSINASLTNLTFSMSPSDIIDLRKFYGRIMSLYSGIIEKKENESGQNKTITYNISVNFSNIVFFLNENNRQVTVPFPFLRLQCNSNSFVFPISMGAVKYEIPFVTIELFNDKLQKWDTLFDPLPISIDVSINKSFVIDFPKGANMIISYDIIKRIKQFSFTRQKFCVKPDYIVENYSNDQILLRLADNTEKILVPGKTIDLYNPKIITFNNTNQIDLQNFFTPQYYQYKYSISLFNKHDFRFLSFNSLFLIKNKSRFSLTYHDLVCNRVINVNSKSISYIDFISSKFCFYANSPSARHQQIELFNLISNPNQIIPIFVNDLKYYYKLRFKFSQKRNVFIILLEPHYTLYNCVKYPVEFLIPYVCRLSIKPGTKQYLDIPLLENYIVFFIQYQNEKSKVINLNLDSQKRDMPVSFSAKNYFSLSYFDSELCIKPLAIFKNKMSYTIEIFDTRSACLNSIPEGAEIPFGTFDYFNEKNLFIYLKISHYHRSAKIEIKHGRLELFLQSKEDGLYLPIVLNTTVDKHGILHIAANYLYIIRNRASHLMILQPLNHANQVYGNPMKIEANETKPITSCTPNLQYSIGIIDNGTIPSLSLKNRDINQLKHVTLRIDSQSQDLSKQLIEINYHCSNKYLNYAITFRKFGFPQPLMISNMLSHPDITIINYNLNVIPMSTTAIYSTSIDTINNLDILIYNKVIKINLNSIDTMIHTIELMTRNSGKIQISLFSEIVILDNGCRLVIISEKVARNNEAMNLSIHMSQFSISILNDKITELAMIQVKDVLLYYRNSNKIDTFYITIDSIQIDDMFPDTENQTLFLNFRKPFLTIEASKFASSKLAFKSISCHMSPSAIVLKENFVADLIHFFDLISSIPTNENTENDANAQSSIIWIDELIIDPVSFDISGIPNANRTKIHKCKYDDVISKIPNISHFDIIAPLLNIKGFNSTGSNLSSILSDYAISAVEMIGVSIMNHAFEYAIKYASNLIHQNDEPDDDLADDMNPIAKGILTGISGLITHPMNDAMKDGNTGLLTGIVKGVAGAFIDVANGAINEKNRQIDQRIKKPRIRIPRALNFNNQIVPFDPQASTCQLLFQKQIHNYFEYFIFYVNGIHGFFAISQNYLVVFDKIYQNNQPVQFSFRFFYKLSEIDNVCTEGSILKLMIPNRPLTIQCQTPQIASIGSKIIFSRIYLTKLALTHQNYGHRTIE